MDQALKLAFVTETYSPEVNGVAMTVGHLVSGLRERGHQITVVRPRQIRGELPFANEVLVAGLPIPGYAGLRVGLPAAGTLSKRWQAERPDVVHIVTEGPLGWSALRAARRLGLPVTSGYHTNFDRYSRHYGASLMTGTIARWLHHFHRQTDMTLVPTQELAKELAIHAIPGLSVVGRGVDTVQFSPMRRDPALRSSWGVEENGLAVLYVGRLAPEKNLGLVEAAYRQIAAHRPGTRMIWVGDGPSRERLQRAHPDHHFARARYGIDLATHYASADLFLFSSLTETYGNVTAEAMASGLAVVVFDCAAASLLVRNAESGALIAPCDPDAFVKAAVHLATEPELRRDMGEAARSRVQPLSWNAVIADFESAIRKTISGKLATEKPHKASK